MPKIASPINWIVLGAAALWMHASPAAARIINFVELADEAGIQFSSDSGALVTKPGAETFHLSSPIVPGGYPADATESHIGISQSADYFLVNILESRGGPISDQVFVHRLNGIFTVIDFISDPDQFVTNTPTSTVVETGTLQDVLNYNNDRRELVSINVQSDVESVPEPTSLALLGAGLAAFGLIRRRRSASAVAA